jgi:CRISPR-associated protein Cmr2
VRGLGGPQERAALPFVVDGLDALRAELGPWVHPTRWDADVLGREFPDAGSELVAAGRCAAVHLVGVAAARGIRAPSPYLAVVTQDLDRLGRALGYMSLSEQRAASAQLSELASRQAELVSGRFSAAHLVYTGGDDLLTFCPVHDALGLAAELRAQVADATVSGPLSTAAPDGTPITASTGVVFFHMSNPLQDAVIGVREAIGQAKSVTDRAGGSRDAVCVVARRRGGVRAAMVQPWRPTAGAERVTDLLAAARPDAAGGELSAGLAGALERDAGELDALAGDRPIIAAEMERLVLRQGGTRAVATALVTLGLAERTGIDGATFRPVPAALVARFLSQEAG